MRYAQIRDIDISNGVGIGVALFVQGCDRRCHNCFNPTTWDFNGGHEWTEATKEAFFKAIAKPFVRRVSILGGEPLAYKNIEGVYRIAKKIKERYPDKSIWLYTGHIFEELNEEQKRIVFMCDVVVDGAYVEKLRDYTLKFRGSSNQRLIDIRTTKETGVVTEVVLKP